MCGIFVCLVLSFIVCLVSSFRYNGFATLALEAFGRVQALCARCRPFGPAIALKRGRRGVSPPAKARGMVAPIAAHTLLVDLITGSS